MARLCFADAAAWFRFWNLTISGLWDVMVRYSESQDGCMEQPTSVEKRLRAKCSYCNGVFEYSVGDAGHSSPCPHCEKNIMLPYPAQKSEREHVHLRRVKWLTVGALVAFTATLVFAPWEFLQFTTYGPGQCSRMEKIAPVYPPPKSWVYMGFSARLRVEVLLVEWMAIGIYYSAGCFVFCRKNPLEGA